MDDEFSFPTIVATDQDSPFPHFAASPLWFLSSAAGAHPGDSTEDDSTDSADSADAAQGGDEDKMDMLWEDFNEELRRASCELRKLDAGPAARGRREIFAVPEGGVGFLHHMRRPSLVVILKMLKKLFLLQKSNGNDERQIMTRRS